MAMAHGFCCTMSVVLIWPYANILKQLVVVVVVVVVDILSICQIYLVSKKILVRFSEHKIKKIHRTSPKNISR